MPPSGLSKLNRLAFAADRAELAVAAERARDRAPGFAGDDPAGVVREGLDFDRAPVPTLRPGRPGYGGLRARCSRASASAADRAQASGSEPTQREGIELELRLVGFEQGADGLRLFRHLEVDDRIPSPAKGPEERTTRSMEPTRTRFAERDRSNSSSAPDLATRAPRREGAIHSELIAQLITRLGEKTRAFHFFAPASRFEPAQAVVVALLERRRACTRLPSSCWEISRFGSAETRFSPVEEPDLGDALGRDARTEE